MLLGQVGSKCTCHATPILRLGRALKPWNTIPADNVCFGDYAQTIFTAPGRRGQQTQDCPLTPLPYKSELAAYPYSVDIKAILQNSVIPITETRTHQILAMSRPKSSPADQAATLPPKITGRTPLSRTISKSTPKSNVSPMCAVPTSLTQIIPRHLF